MLNSNIQLFAEGEPTAEPATTTATEPVVVTQPATQSQGKTYSSDYVHDLREESKSYRQTAKTREAQLRNALGLADGEELGDVDGRINAMREANSRAINEATARANSKLLSAELKGLSGYDTKLLAKVADFSHVEFMDDGTIKGFEEAVAEAEKEFPSVKIQSAPNYVNGTGAEPMSEAYGAEISAFMRSAGLID